MQTGVRHAVACFSKVGSLALVPSSLRISITWELVKYGLSATPSAHHPINGGRIIISSKTQGGILMHIKVEEALIGGWRPVGYSPPSPRQLRLILSATSIQALGPWL